MPPTTARERARAELTAEITDRARAVADAEAFFDDAVRDLAGLLGR